MPGIEARAPERTETSSGLARSPNCRPVMRAMWASAGVDLLLQLLRIFLGVGVVVRADLGGDGEAGRHRQAEVRHLGEVGALAAEQVASCRRGLRPCRRRRCRPIGLCGRACRRLASRPWRRLAGFAPAPAFSALWLLRGGRTACHQYSRCRNQGSCDPSPAFPQSAFLMYLLRLIIRPRLRRACPGHPRLCYAKAMDARLRGMTDLSLDLREIRHRPGGLPDLVQQPQPVGAQAPCHRR